MKRFRKLLHRAVFVDILLILAALASIAGLSLFVRFNKGPDRAAATEPKEQIASGSQYGVLDAATEDTGTEGEAGADQAGDPSGSKSGKDKQNQPAQPPDTKQTCDSARKEALLNEYDIKVTKENERFESLVSSQLKILGGLATIEDIRRQLTPDHLKQLDQIKNSLDSKLSASNCG